MIKKICQEWMELVIMKVRENMINLSIAIGESQTPVQIYGWTENEN